MMLPLGDFGKRQREQGHQGIHRPQNYPLIYQTDNICQYGRNMHPPLWSERHGQFDGRGQAGEILESPAATISELRPFESLLPLPSDLNEGFELMKLAILNHKVSGWREIARDDVLSALESLRQLAPAE
jgi:hypothetical protein